MLPVTEEFVAASKANARRVFSRVRINFTDLFLDTTASPVLTTTEWLTEDGQEWFDETDNSWITEDNIALDTFADQLVNGRRGATRKWVAMDGITTHDGTFFYAPGNADLAASNEIGWWGNVSSDSNGEFPYDQTVEITFSARNVTRMELSADDKRNEYPVDFKYEFFDGSDVLLDTYVVTGNGSFFRLDNVIVNGVQRIRLTITKWSQPGANVKITEISSILEQIFEDDVIENISVTEQREISNNNSVPIGNIAASESTVTLVNQNRQFDANNQDSPFFGSVRPGSRVRVEIGFRKSDGVVEYVPVFSGWSNTWNVPERELNASTSARDRLDLLRRTEIESIAVIENDTFGDWFETVLTDAGITSTEYVIDSVLYTTKYIVPYGWIVKQSHRDALELLATACSASIYQDREGLIRIEAWDYLQRNKTSSVESYNLSNYMDKDNQPEYSQLVNRLTVTTQPRVPAASSTVYETSANEPETINPNATENYTITYEESPVINAVAIVSPTIAGVTVTGANYYAWGAVIEVTNTNGSGQQFQLQVTGQVLNIQGRQTVTGIDQDSIDANGESAFVFPVNDFLQKRELAVDIADGLIDVFSQTQRDLAIAFSPGGSPALELGDQITITDQYLERNYNLTNTVMRYNGGLSMQHRARIIRQFEPWVTEDNFQSWCTEDGEDWLVSQFLIFETWQTEDGQDWLTEDNDTWQSNRIIA